MQLQQRAPEGTSKPMSAPEPDVRGKETGWEGWMVWGGDEWTAWGWGEAGQEGDGGSDGDEGAATEEKVQAVGVGGGENGQAA